MLRVKAVFDGADDYVNLDSWSCWGGPVSFEAFYKINAGMA